MKKKLYVYLLLLLSGGALLFTACSKDDDNDKPSTKPPSVALRDTNSIVFDLEESNPLTLTVDIKAPAGLQSVEVVKSVDGDDTSYDDPAFDQGDTAIVYEFSYKWNIDDVGQDVRFTFIAEDTEGNLAPLTIQIVAGLPPAPTITLSGDVDEENTLTGFYPSVFDIAFTAQAPGYLDTITILRMPGDELLKKKGDFAPKLTDPYMNNLNYTLADSANKVLVFIATDSFGQSDTAKVDIIFITPAAFTSALIEPYEENDATKAFYSLFPAPSVFTKMQIDAEEEVTPAQVDFGIDKVAGIFRLVSPDRLNLWNGNSAETQFKLTEGVDLQAINEIADKLEKAKTIKGIFEDTEGELLTSVESLQEGMVISFSTDPDRTTGPRTGLIEIMEITDANVLIDILYLQ